jgi:hypothetical protein
MASSSRWLRSLGTAILLGFCTFAPAQAANWIEKTFYLSGTNYEGVLPSCEAGLGKITARFSEKERSFWNSDLQILGFERVRETGYSPWALGTVPRRFCRATAQISDGRKHAVFYSIGEDLGMIGMTWGVEWCVVGLDRNWAFNPACKMAKP